MSPLRAFLNRHSEVPWLELNLRSRLDVRSESTWKRQLKNPDSKTLFVIDLIERVWELEGEKSSLMFFDSSHKIAS